jgi:cytochrome c oxidase cbb3-type subunit 3
VRWSTLTDLPLISLVLLASCTGCHGRVGEPKDQDELMRPEEVVSFERLYHQNCSACHGDNGSGGPALDLANPTYQAFVDDASLKRWIASGMPGTQMPAFGESAGGFLTRPQIDALVSGMRSRWSQKRPTGVAIPSYLATNAGNADHGKLIFQASCASCHNQDKQKITDASYLALTCDQSLRTVVIAGRQDLGQPDWEQVRPGQPLADQDVSDIVAYLHSFRSETPGQPYSDESAKR